MSIKPNLPLGWIEKVVSWRTIQQGAFLFVTYSGSSLLNFLYHFILGRLLGPVHYAVLVALIGVLSSVTAPLGLSQLIMTDMTARLVAVNEVGQIKNLIQKIIGGLLLLALVVMVIFIISSQIVARWMNLPSASGVIVLAFAMVPAFMAPALLGSLQGWQEFRGLSLVTLVTGIARLLVGVVLVWLGWSVNGALGGFVAAGLCTVGAAIIFLRQRLNTKTTPLTLSVRGFVGFSLQATLATAAFAILTSTDVIFARRFFQPEVAGYYSAAATLGKIVLFLPGPISVLMFPKSSARHATGIARGSILRKSALATLVISLVVVVFFFVFSDLIVQVYGNEYKLAATWLGRYGIAAAGLALVNLLMLHYLAAHERRFVLLLCLFTALQVSLLNFLPLGPDGYLIVLMGIAWGLVIISEVWLGDLRGRDDRSLPDLKDTIPQ